MTPMVMIVSEEDSRISGDSGVSDVVETCVVSIGTDREVLFEESEEHEPEFSSV